MGKCNAHQLEKWNFCARFQTFCAGEHCRFFEEEKPMTNADHIRSMRDEGLAGFLAELNLCKMPPFVEKRNESFYKSILDWLKQPWKENPDGNK